MKILVIGSINVDMVVKTKRLPEKGETILSESYSLIPGGKGANQAVAVSRMGEDVFLVGKIGNDSFGDMLLKKLEKEGINIKHIVKDKNTHTGTAFITVDEQGNNTIVVAGGANTKLRKKDIDRIEYLLSNIDMMLLQFEVPMETVVHAILLAEKYRVPVLLDPAPAQKCPIDILKRVHILSPNEVEAQSLIGIKVSSLKNARKAALKFMEIGIKNLVIKLGKRGALIASQERKNIEYIEGIKVRAVDSTAAGDAFTAALAVAYLHTGDLSKSVRYACYAGALTTTKIGAQTSIPTRKQVNDFIKERAKGRVAQKQQILL